MLARIEGDIGQWQRMADTTKAWFHYEELAAAHMARARLTEGAEDYAAAGEALTKSFAVAPAGSGPFLRRARYRIVTGELGLVEADIRAAREALEQSPADIGTAESLRGDLALRRGELEAARRHFRAAVTAEGSLAAIGRLAELDLYEGRFDDARRGFEQVMSIAAENRMQQAWAHLQLGNVEYEAGRLSDAVRSYEQAEERFSGWYETAERLGDARFAQGDFDGAIAQYELGVERAPHAGLMAKLGDAFAAKGDLDQAGQWRNEARQRLAVELEKAPAVFAEDAIRFLVGDDPARALTVARKHAAQQPGPAAQVLLAQAQLARFDRRGAQATLRRVLAQGWVGSELPATVSLAFDEDDTSIERPPVDKGVVRMLRARLRLPLEQ